MLMAVYVLHHQHEPGRVPGRVRGLARASTARCGHPAPVDVPDRRPRDLVAGGGARRRCGPRPAAAVRRAAHARHPVRDVGIPEGPDAGIRVTDAGTAPDGSGAVLVHAGSMLSPTVTPSPPPDPSPYAPLLPLLQPGMPRRPPSGRPAPRADPRLSRAAGRVYPVAMCRNIRTLHNFAPPANEDEVRAPPRCRTSARSASHQALAGQRGGVRAGGRRRRRDHRAAAVRVRHHRAAQGPRDRGGQGPRAGPGALHDHRAGEAAGERRRQRAARQPTASRSCTWGMLTIRPSRPASR